MLMLQAFTSEQQSRGIGGSHAPTTTESRYIMKFSELNANEKKFYRKMYEQTELAVGGYENIIQDGGTVENPPTIEGIVSEARAEMNGWIRNNWGGKETRFIGKERMNELERRAARKSLRNSMFAEEV